ncbi:MAG TPA: adenylate/guanylate cyclase domain-containing protein [Methylomirabilota bacterium]|nr:adenylate/guanylate cyclase domain-containing protein [Methylomirabilota bacterium]
MQCPRCQHENPPQAKFCLECGAGFAVACPQCGTKLPVGAKFCLECGKPTDSHGTGPTRFASPQSYTPKHLAEKILTSKAALEGERKQVTVLFADLKGSMGLLADRDPEEARKLLDPVLERMMEAVHRYEGTVNQVMGDGIMALFGAPLAHEDHAVRACYAALRMQESVAQYADSIFRSQGVPIQIRVGLNSGEVVVRAIGSDLHMDYTAVGQTTHLAARMEQMATPGTILLAPATLQLAEGYVQVAARGPVAVKGLPDPVEIYALTGVSAQRTRLHAAAARGLTRFVGRDAEIEQIRRALALAQDGRGQLVAIVGEPGVGKSRLVYEFTHSHRTQEWLILEAGSVSYGKATSYLPVVDLFKAYFKLHERETHREIREKVTGKLLTLDRTLEPILPALLALLDVPVEDAHWQALDPAQRRQRTLDAVKHLLLRESQGQPLLVVFEDLHWIDAETQALLDGLVESLPTSRFLLLVNYRPEYQHGWGRKTYYTQLRLDALPPESAGELLGALLGADPGLEPLKRLLVKRGNPFFIEESIRTLVETGALTGERGAYRLTRPIQAIEVPATVQVILAARIDRLPAEDKQLLQTASVIGKDVPFVLLHAVAEAAEDAVHRGLAHLQAAEFLYETRLFPDPEYTFKHALTHEVTYGTLLQERRKTLHARIVGAIDRFYPDRLSEHVERLAHHAVRGEMWEQAVTYLRQAGVKALARSANREALSCFEQALTALEHLPETHERLELALDLRFDLRTALFPLGEFERIFGCLREAEGLARALDDQRRLAQLSVYLCHSLWMTGHPTEALAFGQNAQAIAESLGDVPLQVTGNLYLGAACFATGDYRRAEDLILKVLELLEGDLSRERFGQAGFPVVMARFILGWIFADRGKFEEGIAHGQEGIRLAEALDHPYSLAAICTPLAYLHIARGELSHAVPLLERGVALSREWDLTFISAQNTGILGYAYALSGRVAEGIPLLEHALSANETMGFAAYQPFFLVYLGEAYVLADRLEDALAFAGRALTLARERGQRGYEAWALRLLGEVAAHRDPPEHADGHYRDALALAEEAGMRPLIAHCHLGLGKLRRHTGKPEQVREHLAAATTLYREMDMRFWLEQAEAEMGA